VKLDLKKNLIDLEYQQIIREYQIWYTFATVGLLGFIGTAISLTEQLKVIGIILSAVLLIVSYRKIKDTKTKLEQLRKRVKDLK